MDKWVQTTLVKALVYGGLGIQGIQDTPFYQWISTPEGLSELGIPPSEPPKLLEVYEDTIKVSRTGYTLNIQFGNIALLKLGTPHPYAGAGYLNVESWLEWATDDITVGRGFVSRDELPEKVHDYIRLDAPLGGLMLPARAFGKSSGTWKFPGRFQDYEVQWLKSNASKIEKAIITQLKKVLSRKLSG